MGQIHCGRFSELTHEIEWPKFLQEQRNLARQHLAAKVIQTRFELGLPLR